MAEIDRLSTQVNNFLATQPVRVVSKDVALFCADTIDATTIKTILEETISTPGEIDRVGGTSYEVVPGFLKLFLHNNELGDWGLRLHIFTPMDEVMQEPWHEHRWDLGSTILTGAINSTNAFAKIHANRKDPDSSERLYYFRVPDKRVVGKIEPQLLGQCVLVDEFSIHCPAGTSYSHMRELAHSLSLRPEDGPTLTAVLTFRPGPNAAFILPENVYAGPDLPTFLGKTAALETMEQVIALLGTSNTSENGGATASPFPNFLYTTPSTVKES